MKRTEKKLIKEICDWNYYYYEDLNENALRYKSKNEDWEGTNKRYAAGMIIMKS